MQNNKQRKQERREKVTWQQKWRANEKRREIAHDIFGEGHNLTDAELAKALRPSKKQKDRGRRENRRTGGCPPRKPDDGPSC